MEDYVDDGHIKMVASTLDELYPHLRVYDLIWDIINEYIPKDDVLCQCLFTNENVTNEHKEIISRMEATLKCKDESDKRGVPLGEFLKYWKKMRSEYCKTGFKNRYEVSPGKYSYDDTAGKVVARDPNYCPEKSIRIQRTDGRVYTIFCSVDMWYYSRYELNYELNRTDPNIPNKRPLKIDMEKRNITFGQTVVRKFEDLKKIVK